MDLRRITLVGKPSKALASNQSALIRNCQRDAWESTLRYAVAQESEGTLELLLLLIECGAR